MKKDYNKMSNTELLKKCNDLTLIHTELKDKILKTEETLSSQIDNLYQIENEYKEVIEILKNRN